MTGSRLMHWILCCLVAAVGVAGCSSDTTTGDTSGSLSLNLELAPGVVINEVDWTLSGNGMPSMSGTIDTSAPGATASVEVFGLLPGEDYLVELEATTEDGEITCRGSAEFDVEIGVSTPVMVMLNCKRPARLGGVRVNGKFNICAQVATAVVSPLQTSVGNDIDLVAQGEDVEDDPISYAWFATGGTIADPTAATTTYTCDEVGDHIVRIVVSDDDAEFCMDEWTVAVTCVEGEAGLCDGIICVPDGNECTETECNPSTGQCETSNLDGAECDQGSGRCMDGECLPADLCEGNTCDDNDTECNDGVCDPADGLCVDKPINEGGECEGGFCEDGECVDRCEGVMCEDLGECIVNACNAVTGLCVENKVPDNVVCADGGGLCKDGVCIITDLCDGNTCDDNDTTCNDSVCDPETGDCVDKPINEGGTCMGGVCIEGICIDLCVGVICEDLGECIVNACNAVTGLCVENKVPDNVVCADGGGLCKDGVCIITDLCDGNTCDDNDTTCNDGVCDPETGDCVDKPINEGSLCDGGNGTCTDGVCVDMCAGVTCPDLGECQDNTCNSLTAQCEASPANEGGSCDGGAGLCKDGECVPTAVPETCGADNGVAEPCLSTSVLADDCFLVTGSVPIPATPVIIPTTPWFDGMPATLFPSAQAVLPNALLCFLDVAASGGADLKDSALEVVRASGATADFLTRSYVDPTDPGPAGTAPQSPHGLVRLDFTTLCTAGVDLQINFFPNNSTGVCNIGSLPGGAGTCQDPDDATNPNIGATCVSDTDCLTTAVLDLTMTDLGLGAAQAQIITPAAPLERFGFTHVDLSIDIGDVIPGTLDNVCIGGACPTLGRPVPVAPGFFVAATDGCAPVDRDGDGCPGDPTCGPCISGTCGGLTGSTAISCTTDADCGAVPTANDSPRVMYDANCGTAAATAGTCSPFTDGDDGLLVDACDIADDTDPLYGQACTSSADCGGAACTAQTMGSLFTTTDFAHLSDCCNGKADAPDPCASIRTAGCTGIVQIYPTATQAQWVPVPVNP